MKFGKIDKNTYVDLLLKTNLNLNKKNQAQRIEANLRGCSTYIA